MKAIKRLLGLDRPTPAPTAPAFDGVHSKNWWATRDAESSSAAAYWGHRTHPSRDAIAQEVAKLPGTSLLEIGVHAGPTMWAIAQRRKFDRLAGTELSAPVLAFAKERLPAALGQPVELVSAAADNLPFPDKSFDIVVTCMVLQCIGPEAITYSLNEMLRVCRGHLVLGEPYSGDKMEACPEGRVDPYPNTSYWIRNYARILEGKAKLISRKMLPPDARMGHLDSVLVFEKT